MNAKNDALGLCAHVSWGGDIFVTSDNDFLKKRDTFLELVPGQILTLREAVMYILSTQEGSPP